MPTTRYSIDPTHSHVGFAVKHLVISTVRGRFAEFTAEAEADSSDLSTARLTATIDAASVTTGVQDRDNHLRSADFFHVEEHPTITFASTSVRPNGGNKYTVTGDLTIHGTTKPVELEAEIEGPAVDPWGNERFGIAAHGKINRTEFGLLYNQALETGGFIVAEDVRLELEAELIAAREPATTP